METAKIKGDKSFSPEWGSSKGPISQADPKKRKKKCQAGAAPLQMHSAFRRREGISASSPRRKQIATRKRKVKKHFLLKLISCRDHLPRWLGGWLARSLFLPAVLNQTLIVKKAPEGGNERDRAGGKDEDAISPG